MKRIFRALIDGLIVVYLKLYGDDMEDRDAILMHLDWNVARRLKLVLDPDTAGDYLRYLENRTRN